MRRAALRCLPSVPRRALSRSAPRAQDPRMPGAGRRIVDDYATIGEKYDTPRYPIVLAHGLLGFAELRPFAALPAVKYWHGIQEALEANGATVLATSVPPSSSIAVRAEELASCITAAQQRRQSPPSSPSTSTTSNDTSDDATHPPPVNIIAHSMGGLDARHLIAHLQSPTLRIASLTTIATPHRGSPVADFLTSPPSYYDPLHLPRLYRLLTAAGLGTEAFSQLTTAYLADTFNPSTPNDPSVRYFSYGAEISGKPPLLGLFRRPWGLVHRAEGPNDGLVSVASSKWGEYKGTLVGVSHLDLINWTNRLAWRVKEMVGVRRRFNAVALYLGIGDMLAKEGL